jgi:hypothetical protein
VNDHQIVDGLKQALGPSTSRVVGLTGRPDGFLLHENSWILLPSKLQIVGQALSWLGEGGTVDALEIGMNRAAERYPPGQKQIFLDALKKMSFTDARHILTGSHTADREYFKTNRLRRSHHWVLPHPPQFHATHRSPPEVSPRQQNRPRGSMIADEFDLDKYIVGKPLDGLFFILGQEEMKIRANPAAQTTALLKEVFARR